MVTLASKAIRDAIGIDSFERAIVYSALLLRSKYGDDFQVLPSLKFGLDAETKLLKPELSISVRGKIAVDASVLLVGANILENIKESIAGNADYTGKDLSPSNNIIAPISADIVEVNCLEKYFYWSLQNLHLALIQGINSDTTLNEVNSVSLLPSIRGSSGDYSLTISVDLKASYESYLIYNNLIAAVGNGIVVDAPLPAIPTIDYLVSNTATPIITGTVQLNPRDTYSIVVDNNIYSDDDILINGFVWSLTIPEENALLDGVYEILATVTNSDGISVTDSTENELYVNTQYVEPSFSQLNNNLKLTNNFQLIN